MTGRLARLVRAAVERCTLDLRGVHVLTEAATGPYAVTAVIAAAAGARVTALVKATRYGTVAEGTATTRNLAERLQVSERHHRDGSAYPELFAAADVITNSGHVRPISGAFADAIRPTAVLSLMFESWEIQAGRFDVDLEALRRRGVRIAGTNERHPAVDVFSFLGPMAVAQLADAGVSAYGGCVAVLCDNPFSDFLRDGLKTAGAEVDVAAELDLFVRSEFLTPFSSRDQLQPTGASVLSAVDLKWIGTRWPECVLSSSGVMSTGRNARLRSGRSSRRRRATWACRPPGSGPNRSCGCRPAA